MYLTNKHRSRRVKPLPMGDELSTVISAIQNAGSTVGAVVNVASDPYLPEVVCHVGQLSAIRSGGVPGACTILPSGMPGGVGLADLILPLRGFVYAQQNKWVYPVAILAILGIPFWLGYETGKG